MSSSRVSLKDQLRRLEHEPAYVDPDSAYSSIDQADRRDAGRDHYLDVGLRHEAGPSTLASDKYGGRASSRMKIFDDDDDGDEEEDGGAGAYDEGEDEEDGEEEEDEDEASEEDEDEEDEGSDEQDDDDGQGDDDESASQPPAASSRPTPASGGRLDPLGALRAGRQKDVEKGRAVKRQRALFDTLLTLRITLQKALTAADALPPTYPADAADGADAAGADDAAAAAAAKRAYTLASLRALSDSLLGVRRGLALPGAEPLDGAEATGDGRAYWDGAARASLELSRASHAPLVGTLAKWSAKIHAAGVHVARAGGAKFAAPAGARGVVDAIDAGLAARREALATAAGDEADEADEAGDASDAGSDAGGAPAAGPRWRLAESEDGAYRALLREVIESRQGVDLGSVRREKKRKRAAERGGSKGRKLRYTVHDKAAHFAVPIPLVEGWHDDQVDELFGSLLGGAALGDEPVVGAGAAGALGAAGLGGLRVL